MAAMKICTDTIKTELDSLGKAYESLLRGSAGRAVLLCETNVATAVKLQGTHTAPCGQHTRSLSSDMVLSGLPGRCSLSGNGAVRQGIGSAYVTGKARHWITSHASFGHASICTHASLFAFEQHIMYHCSSFKTSCVEMYF